MSQKIQAHLKGKQITGDTPNKCPICHHIITLGNAQSIISREDDVQAVFQCPNIQCKSLFIAYYSEGSSNALKLDYLQPIKVSIEDFPEIVSEISPTFISIFEEAEEAKQRNLLQISGPGYRKAFEFLIKDYAKHIAKEEKHEEINKSFSGNVVKDYIGDPRIQAVAKRALWIGNDETHYLRTWREHDINDLITLIKLTVRWIEIEQLSSKYVDEMPE